MKFYKILIPVVFCIGSVAAQDYAMTLTTPPVEVKYINGDLRFCEEENVKGLICSRPTVWGKKMASDWWTPETYVQARTGLNEFTLYGVGVSPDQRHVMIQYSR